MERPSVGCGICAQNGVDMSESADIMTLRSEQTPPLKVYQVFEINQVERPSSNSAHDRVGIPDSI
jgi:hypothetical protein